MNVENYMRSEIIFKKLKYSYKSFLKLFLELILDFISIFYTLPISA